MFVQESLLVLNLAIAHHAISVAYPDRDCIVWRGHRWSWSEIDTRARGFAGWLERSGFGCWRERGDLANWEAGQDRVALCLYNGPEYLEAMTGCYAARCAPINVNYRYTASELQALLERSGTKVVLHHTSLGPVVAEALAASTSLGAVVLVHVLDDNTPPLPGSHPYEDIVSGPSVTASVTPSPDDLYMLYTGGTTGHPKGVLWRQGEAIEACFGVRHRDTDALVTAAAKGASLRVMATAPFMHGAAHWNAWSAWLAGGTIVIQHNVHRLDAADVWDTCAAQQVSALQIVGDAFALPLLRELSERPRQLPHLRFLTSGGVALSAHHKAHFGELIDGLTVRDIVGSSESGRQGVQTIAPGQNASTGTFEPSSGVSVLDESRTVSLQPGSTEIGWLATQGLVPLGYLDDQEATARTFPEIDGRRYAVAGDRARRLADGSIELLGRESVTINTGGEKVFAEEVEQAIKAHPAVLDALVVGRTSERWGAEVVAVIALSSVVRGSVVTGSVASGSDVVASIVTDDELRSFLGETLAGYKLPKEFIRRDAIARTASGKPDYTWALKQL
jgi:3-oxocholest-4-en-26-oate---CoA ligase